MEYYIFIYMLKRGKIDSILGVIFEKIIHILNFFGEIVVCIN
jgi:hypothetical protein